MLFDFDGTLVDSEYLHHESWLAAVARWGVSVGWEEYERELVGISDRRACEFFLRRAGMEPTPERIRDGRARKRREYRRRSVRELAVDPAVARWMRSWHGRVPMAVVSSSGIPDVVPILEVQGVHQFLDFVLCGDHVRHLKPDPEPYLRALAHLREKLPDLVAAECLVFEDSSTGVEAADGAGMAVHRLASPGDLPRALERWSPSIGAVG